MTKNLSPETLAEVAREARCLLSVVRPGDFPVFPDLVGAAIDAARGSAAAELDEAIHERGWRTVRAECAPYCLRREWKIARRRAR
jgi:hypothetical protein